MDALSGTTAEADTIAARTLARACHRKGGYKRGIKGGFRDAATVETGCSLTLPPLGISPSSTL
eukprot:1465220-Prorocentrum_lima.AAC.1